MAQRMNLDYIKNNKKAVRAVLLGISTVLVVLTLVKAGSYFTDSARARSIVEKAVDRGKPDAKLLKKSLADAKDIADGLKKKNLFAPPVPKRNPVSAVLGIMGHEALINGQWYKVGDKIADANVVAIEPTYVRIEWDGKEKSYAPLMAMTARAPEPAVSVVKEPKEKHKEHKPKDKVAKAGPTKAKVRLSPAQEDPLAWIGVDLPPKLRAKVLEKWNKASEEEKRKAKEDWSRMPDEQKEQMVSMMESHIDEM